MTQQKKQAHCTICGRFLRKDGWCPKVARSDA